MKTQWMLRLRLVWPLVIVSLVSVACSPGHSQNAPAGSAAASPEATYGAWRASHIGGGGFLQNVVFTSHPGVLYAYADVVGPWRSDDGGRRWRALYGTLPPRGAYGVRSLDVDPRDANTLIIASGSQWTGVDGIYRSTDGGKSWQKVLTAQFYANEDQRNAGVVLARSPQNSDHILAISGGDGLFVSRDNGARWEKHGLEGIYPTDLKFAADGKTVWISAKAVKLWRGGKQIDLGGGFFRSQDGGATWNKIADEAPNEVLPDPTAPGRLLGAFSEDIRASADNGTTWTPFFEGLPIPGGGGAVSEHRFNALAAGPDFVLTASKRGTFYRLNRGETRWKKIERAGVEELYEGEEWHASMKHHTRPDEWQHFGASLGSIIIDPRDPNHWWFTDWYAAYQSRDAGKNWRLSMDGIELTVIHALQQDPTDPGVVHLGMADNGYLWSENGGVRFHSPKVTANMKSITLSPALPSRLYGVGNRTPGAWESNQVYISLDRGHSWSKAPMTNLPDMGRFRCNSIATDPKNPNVVYLAVSGEARPREGGVYVSRDGAQSWTWMGQGLPGGKGVFRSDIWAIGREIAVSPDGSLCAISRDRREVFRFDPAAQKWSRAEVSPGDVRSVTADLLTPGRFFVGSSQEGVFRSDDGGKSWKKVLNDGAEYVAGDAGEKGRVAAGTADGVMLSEDGGDTWRNADPNLPHRYFSIPAFAGDRLFAGTSGSGVFWMPLSPAAAKPVAAKPALPQVALPTPDKTKSDPVVLPALLNGAMSEGNGVPAGWELSKGAENLVLQRDTTTFRSAPSALQLRSEGGAGKGNTGFKLPVTSDPFTLRGVARMQGQPEEAALAIQVFDGDWKQIGWIQIADFKVRGAGDWREFSQKVALPGGAAQAFLLLTFKGEGKVWLDDLQIGPP